MLQGRPVAVLGGVRIPFCRQNTAYADVGNLGMSVRTLGALVEKFGLHGQQLGEVAMGAVIKHPSDWNLGREATLSSGLSPLTPGITLQRACGTSLDAIIAIGNKIATGQIEAGIGGGSDTTSDVPIVYGQALRRRLLQAARGKAFKDKLAAFKGFHLRELRPDFPGVAEPRTGKSMGDHCEDMARQWAISRDSQDEWAVGSHHKLAAAYERGFFDDLVVSFRGVSRDNNLRADTSLEKLATLKPAFDKNGTVTAGNASGINDGAAAVVLASAKKVKELGLKPLARIKSFASAGVDPKYMGMGPVPASKRTLARAGWEPKDLDLMEINEAFAAQAIAVNRQMGWDTSKVNVNGGAIALGHPIGASGCRVLVTLLHEMQKRDARRGLASLCIGGGMGVAMAVER